MLSLEELKSRIDQYAALVGTGYGPTFQEKPHQHSGGWRIAVDDAGYHLFRYDDYNYGGWEYEFLTTTDLDNLLFWSFQEAVRSEARSYARSPATPGQDRRRIAHARAIELFTRISPTCAERLKASIELSLKTHPYDDAYEHRTADHRQNIESGVSPGDSWRWSLLKYPPPAPGQRLRPY